MDGLVGGEVGVGLVGEFGGGGHDDGQAEHEGEADEEEGEAQGFGVAGHGGLLVGEKVDKFFVPGDGGAEFFLELVEVAECLSVFSRAVDSFFVCESSCS